MIIRGTEVKTTRDLKAHGYLIKEGTVLEVTAADYETDFTIYQLEGSHAEGDISQPVKVWVNGYDFEIV